MFSNFKQIYIYQILMHDTMTKTDFYLPVSERVNLPVKKVFFCGNQILTQYDKIKEGKGNSLL